MTGFLCFTVALWFLLIIVDFPESWKDAVGMLGVTALIDFLALLPVYVIRTVRNDEISNSEKAGWIVGFLFGGVIAIPAYYFKFLTHPATSGL